MRSSQSPLAHDLDEARPDEPRLETEDDALMARIAVGDGAAFAEFVDRHLSAVVAFASRFLGRRGDGEDVAQEALVRVWVKAPGWRPLGPSPRSWLFRIAYNLCVDEVRRRRPVAALEEAGEAPDPGATPEEALLGRDRAERLAAALASLPERQRRALALCAYEGLSNGDAAAALEISVEALESLLARGRRGLRQRLLPAREGDGR